MVDRAGFPVLVQSGVSFCRIPDRRADARARERGEREQRDHAHGYHADQRRAKARARDGQHQVVRAREQRSEHREVVAVLEDELEADDPRLEGVPDEELETEEAAKERKHNSRCVKMSAPQQPNGERKFRIERRVTVIRQLQDIV